ncbi:unnamed protein product, partial [Pylaiella littoralis]
MMGHTCVYFEIECAKGFIISNILSWFPRGFPERLRDCTKKDFFSQIPENPGMKGYLERIFDLPSEPISARHLIGLLLPASYPSHAAAEGMLLRCRPSLLARLRGKPCLGARKTRRWKRQDEPTSDIQINRRYGALC